MEMTEMEILRKEIDSEELVLYREKLSSFPPNTDSVQELEDNDKDLIDGTGLEAMGNCLVPPEVKMVEEVYDHLNEEVFGPWMLVQRNKSKNRQQGGHLEKGGKSVGSQKVSQHIVTFKNSGPVGAKNAYSPHLVGVDFGLSGSKKEVTNGNKSEEQLGPNSLTRPASNDYDFKETNCNFSMNEMGAWARYSKSQNPTSSNSLVKVTATIILRNLFQISRL
ncbi:hypothetical protein TanjilG_08783 [Lupinus angustifolius]|uniref:Uncharacterized protein n=1 Tax=Lupinus angustifolius TaxID=3871 RepID=A0A1J7H537_LUPAN|nr:hypothetical protein TanjilG_08783 [Lupinus angustifolius]